MMESGDASPIFDWPPDDDDVRAVQRELRTVVSDERTRSLTLRIRSSEPEVLQPLIDVIGEAPRPALRRLVLAEFGEPLGDWIEHGEPYGCWAPLGDLSRLWRHLPALDELTLQGESMELGKIDLRAARIVAIRGTLSSTNLRSIASANWPSLESLEIFFGDPEEGADGSLTDISPILAGDGLPHLRHLGLCFCSFVDEIVEDVSRIAVLPRLRTLDLSLSDLTTEGKERLYEQRALLSHLVTLVLEDGRTVDWLHEP